MTITSAQIPAILEAHRKWAAGIEGETRANLAGADLTGADLTGAYLTGAYLTRAGLYEANLAGANLTGANLAGADLTGADLTGAYLTGADLTGADLTGAYLTGGKFVGMASVQFTGHGECGRQLTVIRDETLTTYLCGCFKGTEEELRKYIAAGPARLAKTRTLALDTLITLLAARNDD